MEDASRDLGWEHKKTGTGRLGSGKKTNRWAIMSRRFGNQQKLIEFELVMSRKEGAVSQPPVRDTRDQTSLEEGKQMV